jgi:Lon protease-like protein
MNGRPGARIEIPIFPLPSTVLFPGALLPLHVFEPRYRAMTRAALEGGRRIAMALLLPGWEADYQGAPPVHAVACAADIVAEEKLDDGRFNLLLRGFARVRIEREHPPDPFRVALGYVVEDTDSAAAAGDGAGGPAPSARAREVATLMSCCRQLALRHAELARTLPVLEEMTAQPAALTDALAHAFVTDPFDRQELLETFDVSRRIGRVTEALGTLILAGAPAVN